MISKNQQCIETYLKLEDINSAKNLINKHNYKTIKNIKNSTNPDLKPLTDFVSINKLEVDDKLETKKE